MRTYKLTDESIQIEYNGEIVTLYRIEAIINLPQLNVKVGDKGGYIQSVNNLSGNAWVYGNAMVYGNAEVSGNAKVSGNAEVSGNAWVSGNAKVSGYAWVSGNADVVWFSKFGSVLRTTTAYKTKGGGVEIACGCFCGSVAEFEDEVNKRHGNSKFGREYRAIIEVIKIHFEL